VKRSDCCFPDFDLLCDRFLCVELQLCVAYCVVRLRV